MGLQSGNPVEIDSAPIPSGGRLSRRRTVLIGLLAAITLLCLGPLFAIFAIRYQNLARVQRIDRVCSRNEAFVLWDLSPLPYRIQAFLWPYWTTPQFVDDFFQEVTFLRTAERTSDLKSDLFNDLRAFHQIKEIHWLDTRHSAQVAALIRAQKGLRRLLLIGKGLRDADLRSTDLFSHLTELSVDGLESPALEGRFLDTASSTTPLLKVLALNHIQLTSGACIALPRFSNLEFLDLTGSSLSATSALGLAHLPKLKHLTLDGVSVDGALGPTLGSIKTLEHLSIKGMRISDGDLCALASCRRLKTLDTGGRPGSAKLLSSLQKCYTLRSLDIIWTGDFTESDISGFSNLRDVTYLYFANIGDPEAAYLSGCRHLTGLDIQAHQLTVLGVELLMGLPQLRYLNLSGSDWGPELVDLLRQSERLESVKLLGRTWKVSEFDELRQELGKPRGVQPR